MVERGRDGQQRAGGIMAGGCRPERSLLGEVMEEKDVILRDLNEYKWAIKVY